MGLFHLGSADLVLSGINLGSNLGSDIWHSGTVAAAKQGVIFGVQAIAFSQVLNGEEPTYEKQKPYIAEVIKMLTSGDQPRLVNVNLPENPLACDGRINRFANTTVKLWREKTPMGAGITGLRLRH